MDRFARSDLGFTEAMRGAYRRAINLAGGNDAPLSERALACLRDLPAPLAQNIGIHV